MFPIATCMFIKGIWVQVEPFTISATTTTTSMVNLNTSSNISNVINCYNRSNNQLYPTCPFRFVAAHYFLLWTKREKVVWRKFMLEATDDRYFGADGRSHARAFHLQCLRWSSMYQDGILRQTSHQRPVILYSHHHDWIKFYSLFSLEMRSPSVL